jgi:hypothetical protein
MPEAARSLAAALGAALLLTAIGFVVADLAIPPHATLASSSPTRRNLEPIGPVDAGRRFQLVLPQTSEQPTTVQLLVATYGTAPQVAIRACSALDCTLTRGRAKDNEWHTVQLPSGFASGSVDVVIEDVNGGALALWGEGGEPGWRIARAEHWQHYADRADEHGRAAAGFRVRNLAALAAVSGLLVFALCLRQLVRGKAA